MKKFLCVFSLILLIHPCFASSTPVPSNNGRFVFVTTSRMDGTFLLDTKTGKTWNLIKTSDDDFAWVQCKYEWFKQDGSFGGYSRTSVPAQ